LLVIINHYLFIFISSLLFINQYKKQWRKQTDKEMKRIDINDKSKELWKINPKKKIDVVKKCNKQMKRIGRKNKSKQCRKEMINNNLFFKKLKLEMRMNEYMFIWNYINSKLYGAVAKFVKHKHNRGEKRERMFWRECRGFGFRKQGMKRVRGMGIYMSTAWLHVVTLFVSVWLVPSFRFSTFGNFFFWIFFSEFFLFISYLLFNISFIYFY